MYSSHLISDSCNHQEPTSHRHRVLLGVLMLGCFGLPSWAFAAEQAVSRPALVHLARQLVDSTDYNFERADNYLDMVNGRENFKTIPDGEILLLQIRVGNRDGIAFNQPVLGIKQSDDVLLSLFDFFSVAQFAIDVKPVERIAEGWFIRENRRFKLDGQTMTISADGNTYSLSEGDVAFEESDILVRSSILAKVFQFQGNVSVRYQRVVISTAEKWPAIEKLERLRRRKGELLPPPSAPRQDDPYQWISIPNIDVATNYNFSKEGESGDITRERSHSLVMAGDMLKHSARIVASGDDEHAVQAASAIFERESDKNDLLGRMKARSYQFGDISGVSVPGGNISGTGVGMRVSNKNPYVTADETTILEGDINPGWDAELYRGQQYLDSMTNAETGRYRFEDVRLSGGENRFRVVKFGPLGELEEEEIIIYSTPRLSGAGHDQYEASVALSDTALWTRNTSHSQDKYTPIMGGTWERRVGIDTSVKAGFATSQQEGQQKVFTHGGVATYLGSTIVNAGLTADIDGSIMGSITARQRILGQDTSFGADYIGADYGAVGDASSPSSYALDFYTRGGLPKIFDYSLGSYSFTTNYTEDEEGVGNQRSILALTHRLGGLSLNNRFTHRRPFGGESENEQTLDGSSGVMGVLWRTRWRAGVDYGLDPENHINAYSLELNRRLMQDVNGRLAFAHEPENDFNQADARVVWSHENFNLSPGVSYDSDRNLKAYVSANFGLAYDPYSSSIAMSGKKLSNTASVSAFVYLDKDGDLTFSEGDEPISDAVVEAVHAARKGDTDESGQAFIYNMPDNMLTDVRVEELSLFDPFMVAATEGRSVLPRSGHTTRVELPVHNGGELDGNVYVIMNDGKDRSAKNVRIYLHESNGKLAQTANVSFDGFYLFQKIHPGQYWLMVDAKDAGNQGMIRPLPQKISFGYDGTIIYGHKILLRKAEKDQHDVPSTIGEDYTGWLAANPSVNAGAIKGNLVLNLGDYRSRALQSVVWYKLKMFNAALIKDVKLLVPVSQSNPAADTGLHSLRAVIPRLTMQQAWDRCYAVITHGVSCKIEMLPTGLESDVAATAEQQQAQLILSR